MIALDLFGRKKYEDRIKDLEARISTLEGEREALERTLERREERIKKLVQEYQEAKVALKETEQKPRRLQPVKEYEERLPRPIKGKKLWPSELLRLADRLEEIKSNQGDLLSAYLSPEEDLPPEAKEIESESSETGWIVLHYPGLFTLALIPPFPPSRKVAFGEGFSLDPLREQLETPILLVSAHAGETLIGVALSWEGMETSNKVESQVKEKHSKGGWSQRRFERLREEDIRHHAEEVVETLKGVMDRYRSLIRYAVVGGDDSLLKMIIPVLDMPVLEKGMDRHEKKYEEGVLNDAYSFVLYRI